MPAHFPGITLGYKVKEALMVSLEGAGSRAVINKHYVQKVT